MSSKATRLRVNSMEQVKLDAAALTKSRLEASGNIVKPKAAPQAPAATPQQTKI